MKLDLGCGPFPREGYEGVDLVDFGQPHIMNLQHFPWDFKDDSVEAACSHHLVEHLPDLVGFMRELWRVMEPGGLVEITHPYQFHIRAYQDPTHVRSLNEVTHFYWDKKWRRGEHGREWGDYGETDFELVELDAIPDHVWQELAEKNPPEFERACRNLVNVISDLRVILRCRK